MIRIELPFLPPSVNHAYFTNRYGGRVLSAAGKSFKNQTKTLIARQHPKELLKILPDQPYLVLLRLFFDRIENKGWPNKTKSRYKHFDGSNYIKLVEDALMDATGVDDANNMTLIVSKEVGTPEKSIIYLWSLQDEECPIYDLIQQHE